MGIKICNFKLYAKICVYLGDKRTYKKVAGIPRNSFFIYKKALNYQLFPITFLKLHFVPKVNVHFCYQH